MQAIPFSGRKGVVAVFVRVEIRTIVADVVHQLHSCFVGGGAKPLKDRPVYSGNATTVWEVGPMLVYVENHQRIWESR